MKYGTENMKYIAGKIINMLQKNIKYKAGQIFKIVEKNIKYISDFFLIW